MHAGEIALLKTPLHSAGFVESRTSGLGKVIGDLLFVNPHRCDCLHVPYDADLITTGRADLANRCLVARDRAVHFFAVTVIHPRIRENLFEYFKACFNDDLLLIFIFTDEEFDSVVRATGWCVCPELIP